jgi:predicted dehydrogenase
MLEKPAGLSLDDALHLQKTASDHPVPLLVSHQHLFSNVYQELKKRVNGEEVMQIETSAGNDGPYRDYSFIWDYAPHDIAMILGLKPLEPKIERANIQSSSEYGGQCEFVISFEDGSRANAKIWNDRYPKSRLFSVKIQNKVYEYDDHQFPSVLIENKKQIPVNYTPPLTNAIVCFLNAVDQGKTADYRFGARWSYEIGNLIDQIYFRQNQP